MACQRFDSIAAHGVEIVYKHSCRICLCDGIRVSQIRISKKEGHFFPAFSMLCIEARESFPEIIYRPISLILGRGKRNSRYHAALKCFSLQRLRPGETRKGYKTTNRIEKDRINIRSRIKLIALTTRSGSHLSKPPSKTLCLPAWRPIHWIRPFDRIPSCLFCVEQGIRD